MLRKPTQSSSYAATPDATPSPSTTTRAVTTGPSPSSDTSPPRGQAPATAAARCRHAGQLEDRVRVVALEHPAVRAEDARPPRSPAAPPRSAAVPRRRRRRRPRRSRRRPRTAPSPAPSSPAAPSTWRSGAAASRRPAGSRGPGHSASARAAGRRGATTRSRGEGRGADRLAGHDVGDRDPHGGPGGWTGVHCHDAPAVAPRRTRAEHVGQRRAAARSGLARKHTGGPPRAGRRRAVPARGGRGFRVASTRQGD